MVEDGRSAQDNSLRETYVRFVPFCVLSKATCSPADPRLVLRTGALDQGLPRVGTGFLLLVFEHITGVLPSLVPDMALAHRQG